MEYKVLFIDDEPDLLEILSLEFQSHGYKTWQAKNGLEALTFFNPDKEAFDVIVSDLQMPKMNGLELLKELRHQGVLTPFIFFSGYGGPQETSEARRLGAMRFIEKPHDPQAFVKAVTDAAQLGRSLKKNK